jgi:hypothetical protein
MFENFKAFDDDFKLTEDCTCAVYLVILNEKGYTDASKWITEKCMAQEALLLTEAESCYYEYDGEEGMYTPIDENKIPLKLTSAFYEYHGKNVNSNSQKFKIKIQLVNGITIEPNLHSDNFHEIADVIQELSCEKLFAGQIKNIKIE